MIAGIFHQGSGLGNQLFRYVTTRTLAQDKGVSFGMVYNPDGSGKVEGFKGKGFMNIDMGEPVGKLAYTFTEKKVVENGVDIRGYDPEVNFIQDSTLIEGEFQDERYWGHNLKNIDEWLRVEPVKFDLHRCVIGFRGGEYSVYPDLFLTKEYWDDAIYKMRSLCADMSFEVHTDDPVLAKKFFPDFPIIADIGVNWRSVRYAPYIIMANSSFYILPALLGNAKHIIAPRYWARRNTKTWALPQNYYKRFTYI